MDLKKELPPLSNHFKEWAKTKMMKLRTHHYSSTVCLECNYKTKKQFKVCPNCGAKTTFVTDLYNGTTKAYDYMEIFTTVRNYQVINIVYVSKLFSKKRKPQYIISSVVQHWIREDGKIVSLMRKGASSYYGFFWSFSEELEVRNKSYSTYHKGNITGIKYPKRKILPIIIRNGYVYKEHKIHNAKKLMHLLLTNSKIETLAKAKQKELLSFAVNRPKIIDNIWGSIKIAIRNNYYPDDANIWIDHLVLLERFGKDIRNPKYICPEHLLMEHQKYIRKKNDLERKIEYAKLKAKIETYNKSYVKEKNKFFNLFFKKNNISVEPLKSVKEFYEEGKAFSHCIFTNKYFEREDSLILSAKINDEKVETVEVDLNTMRVEQSRGENDNFTKYHNEIVNLVTQNIKKIERVMRNGLDKQRI